MRPSWMGCPRAAARRATRAAVGSAGWQGSMKVPIRAGVLAERRQAGRHVRDVVVGVGTAGSTRPPTDLPASAGRQKRSPKWVPTPPGP